MEHFYPGLHQNSDAQHFDRCCIHVDRLGRRRKPLGCEELLLDSHAFERLKLTGRYITSTRRYAREVERIAGLVPAITAVTEDYMCEPWIVAKTGLSVHIHQVLTTKRYDAIRRHLDPAIALMPVVQGYTPREYVRHLAMYGDRLERGAWVGVGSVCKRNTDPTAIVAVLEAIAGLRPDLRLHGFGVKLTALRDRRVRHLLATADSMAWSMNARKNGRNGNDWREAARFAEKIAAAERPIGDLPMFRM